MTDTPTSNPDAAISEKTERLEEIIARVEAGEVSLERKRYTTKDSAYSKNWGS